MDTTSYSTTFTSIDSNHSLLKENIILNTILGIICLIIIISICFVIWFRCIKNDNQIIDENNLDNTTDNTVIRIPNPIYSKETNLQQETANNHLYSSISDSNLRTIRETSI